MKGFNGNGGQGYVIPRASDGMRKMYIPGQVIDWRSGVGGEEGPHKGVGFIPVYETTEELRRYCSGDGGYAEILVPQDWGEEEEE